jgi:hypothetical protein
LISEEIFENFNISENNIIISVELAKVLRYPVGICYEVSGSQTFASNYDDLWLNNKKGFFILSSNNKTINCTILFSYGKINRPGVSQHPPAFLFLFLKLLLK